MRRIWADSFLLKSAAMMALIGLLAPSELMAQKSRRVMKRDETLSVQNSSAVSNSNSGSNTVNSTLPSASGSLNALPGGAKVLVAPGQQAAAPITAATSTTSDSGETAAMLSSLLGVLTGKSPQGQTVTQNADGSTTTTSLQDNGDGTETETKVTKYPNGYTKTETTNRSKPDTNTTNSRNYDAANDNVSSDYTGTQDNSANGITSRTTSCNSNNSDFFEPPFNSNYVVTSCFGPRKGIPGIVSDNHRGVDIVAKDNKTVQATLSGQIVFASYVGGYGCTVVIKHDRCPSSVGKSPCFTQYSHMGRKGTDEPNCKMLRVSVGQKVTPCTMLGPMGDTGNGTAAHLHFAVMTNYNGPGADGNVDVDPSQAARTIFQDKNKKGEKCNSEKYPDGVEPAPVVPAVS